MQQKDKLTKLNGKRLWLRSKEFTFSSYSLSNKYLIFYDARSYSIRFPNLCKFIAKYEKNVTVIMNKATFIF